MEKYYFSSVYVCDVIELEPHQSLFYTCKCCSITQKYALKLDFYLMFFFSKKQIALIINLLSVIQDVVLSTSWVEMYDKTNLFIH